MEGNWRKWEKKKESCFHFIRSRKNNVQVNDKLYITDFFSFLFFAFSPSTSLDQQCIYHMYFLGWQKDTFSYDLIIICYLEINVWLFTSYLASFFPKPVKEFEFRKVEILGERHPPKEENKHLIYSIEKEEQQYQCCYGINRIKISWLNHWGNWLRRWLTFNPNLVENFI